MVICGPFSVIKATFDRFPGQLVVRNVHVSCIYNLRCCEQYVHAVKANYNILTTFNLFVFYSSGVSHRTGNWVFYYTDFTFGWPECKEA